MADLTITPADVVVSDTTVLEVVEVGTTVSAGDVIVLDSANSNWILASNTTAALSGNGIDRNIKIALSSGTSGQRIVVSRPNSTITLGSVLTTGRVYVLSASGAISPESDATTGDYVTILGYAASATDLVFDPISTGLQVA